MKSLTLFGTHVLNINNTIVYTFRSDVSHTDRNEQILKNFNIGYRSVLRKHKPMLSITITSLDAKLFAETTKTIGQALKQIAQANLNDKYAWTE